MNYKFHGNYAVSQIFSLEWLENINHGKYYSKILFLIYEITLFWAVILMAIILLI